MKEYDYIDILEVIYNCLLYAFLEDNEKEKDGYISNAMTIIETIMIRKVN